MRVDVALRIGAPSAIWVWLVFLMGDRFLRSESIELWLMSLDAIDFAILKLLLIYLCG